MSETVACDLCGNASARPFFTTPDRLSGEEFSFVRCQECGLVYLNPRPSPAEMDRYYPPSYEPYQTPAQSSPIRPADIARTMQMQVDFVAHHHPACRRLLDVGSGAGHFLRAAHSQGWETTGIEFSQPVAEQVQEQAGLPVLPGTLESNRHNPALPPASFDAITLWDVLEHLPSPVSALEHCYRLLAPGGMLFLSIPNLDSYDRYLFGKTWIGWDVPRHFYLFTPVTLRNLLANTGFSLLEEACMWGGKGTFFMSLDNRLGAWAPRLAGLYPLLGLALWPYRQIAYRLRHGPILTYAAQKTNPQEG